MIFIQKMNISHIEEVYYIEESCFSIPWSKKSFQEELSNKMAIYIVAIEDNKVLGYAGMWHVINEGHITNIAVHKDHRNRGIAKIMVNHLIKIAQEKEMIGITLEVRVSNEIAKNLYKNLGFILEGIRKEYYENKEDAYIMWKYL